MSTPATAKSSYLKNLVSQFAPRAKVLKLGCPGLEEAVEHLNREDIKKLAKIFGGKVKKHKSDVVILGCTHFPFAKAEIQQELGFKVQVIDSGESIAKRLKEVLKGKDGFSDRKNTDFFYTTGNASEFSFVASELLNQKINGETITI